MGKVILLGGGPGDEKLLTIKGKEALEQADCVIYDRLISPSLLRLCKDNCEMIYVGKENHHHALSQEEMNVLLAEKAQQYTLVVRLKGGDPYVFGRGGEEFLYLQQKEIEVEVIPGISSAIAALAYAGIPITHRGLANGFHVLTAHSKEDSLSQIPFETLTNPEETLVFLMGLAHVGQVARKLIEVGRAESTPAAVVSHGTTMKQQCVCGTLLDIEKRVIENGITSPAIIVVGEVVRLREQLAFFENKPLFGKRYCVPYIVGEEQEVALADLLKQQGAQCDAVAIGKIEYRAEAIDKEQLKNADWIIFTSRHAVIAFVKMLNQEKLDGRCFAKAKIAVVGEKTSLCLQKYGYYADFVPKRQTAEGLAMELLPYLNSEKNVLHFSAVIAASELENLLKEHCQFKKIDVYENQKLSWCREKLEDSYDGIIFTSASAVERIQIEGVRCYSIGPKTSAALEKYGKHPVFEAGTPSYEALVEGIVNE